MNEGTQAATNGEPAEETDQSAGITHLDVEPGAVDTLSRRGALTALTGLGLLGLASGPASADSGHDHLGQTWSGSVSPGLEIQIDSGDALVARTTSTANNFDFGIVGRTNAQSGRGVAGFADNDSGNSIALLGRNQSSNGVGIRALCDAETGATNGIFGQVRSPTGRGIYATNTSESDGPAYGCVAQSNSSAGTGLLGTAIADSGETYGVRGEVASPDGYGLYTPDDAKIDGVLTSEDDWVVEVDDGEDAGNVVAGHASNDVEADAVGATIGGGGFDNETTVEPNEVFDDYGTVGGGRANQAGIDAGDSTVAAFATVSGGQDNVASAVHGAVGGGWKNVAEANQSVVGGGLENEASGIQSMVGGGYRNDATQTRATIGGGSLNVASSSSSTVGGGSTNTASGSLSTIGGGVSNTASDWHSTVGGGNQNEATGMRSTISGGDQNESSGTNAFVGAGEQNSASAWNATVAGGNGNTASGQHSTVLGGRDNTADGDYSVVAGRNANATQDGQFIFTDSLPETENHSTNQSNRLYCMFDNGYHLRTDSVEGNAGVWMGSGASSWSSISSADKKTDIVPADTQDVLDKVVDLEISTWSYKWKTDTKHMGPMAGEFHEAFGLGDSDEAIQTIDADGVLFGAVKGLAEKLEKKDERIDELRTRLESKDAHIDELIASIDALAERVTTLEA